MEIKKPINLPIKDYIVRKISVKSLLPEETVHEILKYQYKDIFNATKKFNEVEISGLGKFIFRINKARKHLKNYRDMEQAYLKQLEKATTEKEKETLNMKLESCRKMIDYLAYKVDYEDKKQLKDQTDGIIRDS